MASNITCTFTDKPYKLDNKCLRNALFGTTGFKDVKTSAFSRADLTTAFVRQAPISPGDPKGSKSAYMVSGNIKCPEDPLCKCVVEDFAVISTTKCYYDAQGKMVCGPEAEKQYNCKPNCKINFH